MITRNGPELIEYNVRFGDPECQVILMRLMSDLLPALIASTDGVLASFDLRWYTEAALTVVMAAKGYRGASENGRVIGVLALARGTLHDAKIFHAATRKWRGRVKLARGGRLLGRTTLQCTLLQP